MMPSAANPASSETLGPRAMAFIQKSESTKKQILETVLNRFKTDTSLSPQDFVAKNITAAKQEELSNLDRRTNALFRGIIADVYLDIIRNRRDLLTSLMMLNQVGDNQIQGKFVKEAALPLVKSLVAELDRDYPNLVDEATSGELPQQSQAILQALQL